MVGIRQLGGLVDTGVTASVHRLSSLGGQRGLSDGVTVGDEPTATCGHSQVRSILRRPVLDLRYQLPVTIRIRDGDEIRDRDLTILSVEQSSNQVVVQVCI